MTERIEGHGGELALAALRAHGVREMFTLSGGHVFPLYDAAHKTDFPIYDVRHEQSAVFAAEAVAKLQRRPGLAVLTAGPGVTNGISGMTSAFFNASPVLVLGGRAPAFRWGSGSLQEMDHLPLVASGHQARRDGVQHRRHPARGGRGAERRAHPAPRPGLPRLPAGDGLLGRRGRAARRVTGVDPIEPDPEEVAPAPRCSSPRRSGRSSSPAPTCTRATRSPRCARRPRRCRCRSSPTAWAAARCRRSTRSRSPRPAGPRSPAPTWSWWSAPRWTSGSASATSATRRWCTSSTRPASGRRTCSRPSRPPVTCA